MNYKKIFFVTSFVVILSLTGCFKGRTVKCSKTRDGIEAKVTLKYDGSKNVTKVDHRQVLSDEDVAKELYEYYSNLESIKDLKINGKEITYSTDADVFKEELYATDTDVDTIKAILVGIGYTCR